MITEPPGGPVRKQRVRVPMRLVLSSAYADVALSVYMKVKALGQRPEGCQAKSATLAAYLGLSKASVERGLTALMRPAVDGVVELVARRRTLRSGRGTSALREVRTMTRSEPFAWLPVAAAEDLTPRQLRAYAVIRFAEQRGIALTEAELAGHLLHHSGKRAGRPITVEAAGRVVDELETARWVTVQRRAGVQGRHLFVAHDLAQRAAGNAGDAAEVEVPRESGSPPVGEGSGSRAGEGSLANREAPMTDRPEHESRPSSPAVGEVPVGERAASERDLTDAQAKARTRAPDGFALRADGPARPAYTGPQLSLSPQVYAVLEPVHWLLKQVRNAFVVRQIAREAGRQLREGMDPERLRHRLTLRFAGTAVSDIRDPGRWLLGVALPRWGCGHLDCEAGVMWSTGRRCDVCAEVVAARSAARRRDRRAEQVQGAVHHRPAVPAQRRPEETPRGSCDGCGARILVTGQAQERRLCTLCRAEAAAPATPAAQVSGEPAPSAICRGADGVACGRTALPDRDVCIRHRVRELSAEPAPRAIETLQM
ncbi:hypothetical protein OG898_35640 [Streptomyces sp. NBC_00193]|uniref:hypothetical protein n=1 Tax=Streptomyces sp. NBC_00193 TaxID=2975675 RepID=UPI00225258B9|nr:hypothetical protein [Streptomyces sp. NBC_00193]MCX5301745.1 hypothetical protein [Streptomyces sp. NBC_00193]